MMQLNTEARYQLCDRIIVNKVNDTNYVEMSTIKYADHKVPAQINIFKGLLNFKPNSSLNIEK